MKTLLQLKEAIEESTAKSAWSKGVKVYAYELIEEMEEDSRADYIFTGSTDDKKKLLNGAENWKEYSRGGCSLIYNGDIAERLCTPSELKKTKNGERNPNKNEEWLDTQARALYQAERLILRLARA